MTTLGAVCAYFNPYGYRSRRRNYDAFRRNIERPGVTVLTVELVFDSGGISELGAWGDVLCVRGGDVMWQKERLLQIGIDRLLADGYGAVAWLDADIVFGKKNWHEHVLRSLEEFDCVQSFEYLVNYYPEGRLVRPAAARDRNSWAHGGSWAATRQFWQQVRLYQHCVLGGADTVMAHVFCRFGAAGSSAFCWPEENPVLGQFNPALREHVAAWAQASWRPWRIGYVADQTAHLLPHGARRHRYYVERWRVLEDYDPGADVVISDSGAFRWCCDKPRLQRLVRDYFYERREDG